MAEILDSIAQATHRKITQKLKGPYHSKELFFLLAETFQALGDTSRIQIVWALSQGELSVGAIAKLLEMSQPAVSHHLRSLRNLRLVSVRKVGTTAYYSLDDEHIERLLLEGIEHVQDLMKKG
jgi:DNA-binding transcriptional ArsR family regulator